MFRLLAIAGVLLASTQAALNVIGNGLNIPNGEEFPSMIDDTQFGRVCIGASPIRRQFTISNDGSTMLRSGAIQLKTPAVTVTPLDDSIETDFTIGQPEVNLVPAGESVDFTVTFTPSTNGWKTARINVHAADGTFTFVINGRAIAPQIEAQLLTMPDRPLADLDFGETGESTSMEFIVKNLSPDCAATVVSVGVSGTGYAIGGVSGALPVSLSFGDELKPTISFAGSELQQGEYNSDVTVEADAPVESYSFTVSAIVPDDGGDDEEVPTFDFASCSGGTGSFQRTLTEGDWIKIGDIPEGQVDLQVNLTALEDLDITLYDVTETDPYEEGLAIVGWCKLPCNKGILSGSKQGSTEYKGMTVTYSGFNGVNGQRGNEFIRITGRSSVDTVLGVFAYKSGTATVDYSWVESDTECCRGEAACGGDFERTLERDAVAVIGEIPTGKATLEINLNATADLDIQLYDMEEEPPLRIIGWCRQPCDIGLLSGRNFDSVEYKGITYEYSGWGGVGGNRGHEFIRIIGTTNTLLEMRTYAYRAGTAVVDYSYFEPQITRG